MGGELACEVGDQSSGHNRAGVAAAAEEIFSRNAEAFADSLDDAAEPNWHASDGHGAFASKEALDGSRADLPSESVKFNQGAEPGDRAFDFSNGTGAAAGDQVFCSRREVETSLAGESTDEFRAGSAIGALHTYDPAGEEATDE